MAIRIPKNQIQYKYTIGKEYMYKNTFKEYQGHYYIINNNIFAGKEFNIDSPELVVLKSKGVNSIQSNPEVERYIKLAKNLPPLDETPPKPLENILEGVPDDGSSYTAYFYKKILDNKDILIKQISKVTFDTLKNDPTHQTISVLVDQGDAGISFEEINRAEKEMPGFYDWFLYGTPLNQNL
jgi:hypothetical protein